LTPGLLSSRRNTYSLLGKGFTLFTVDKGYAAAWQAAASALSVPLKVVIGGVPAYQAAHVLVRPDQFVAWADDEATSPETVLSRAIGALPG
jgi:hypothetical protein